MEYKNNNEPSVGIAIAVWKNSPSFFISVGSAMMQSYKNCKIKISDNHSGIEQDLIKQFTKCSDKDIQIYKHKKELDFLSHYEFCFRIMEDIDYLIVMSQDDELNSYAVENLMNKIKSDNCKWAYGSRISTEIKKDITILDYIKYLSSIRSFLSSKYRNVVNKSTYEFSFHSLMSYEKSLPIFDWFVYLNERNWDNMFDDQLLTTLMVNWGEVGLISTPCYLYDNSNWNNIKARKKSIEEYAKRDDILEGKIEKRKIYFLLHIIDCLLIFEKDKNGRQMFFERIFFLIKKNKSCLELNDLKTIKKLLKKTKVICFIETLIDIMEISDKDKNLFLNFYFEKFKHIKNKYIIIDNFEYIKLSILYSNVFENIEVIYFLYSSIYDYFKYRIKNFYTKKINILS